MLEHVKFLNAELYLRKTPFSFFGSSSLPRRAVPVGQNDMQTEPFCVGSGTTDTEHNGTYERSTCGICHW